MPTFWRLILHLNLNVACINLWWQLGILYDFFFLKTFFKGRSDALKKVRNAIGNSTTIG